MSNNKSFYRYRSVEKLLNQHELQDGYIYFSPFKDLNDPMEGFIKLTWDGDLIAWKNLLRMYIICLDDTLASLSVGRTIDYKNHELPVFLSDSYFEGTFGNIHLKICTRTYQEIIAIPSIKNFLDYIAARHEVDRTELKFYLDLLHGIILEALCRHSVSCKFLSANPLEKHRDGIHADFNKRFAVLSKMFLSSTITNLDIELSDRFDFYHIFKQYDSSLKDDDGDYRSILVLGYKFPQIFLDNLGKLIFNDWYVASFSTDFSNSSMWAYYGENHCGVCLEFCATQSECLPLLIKTGISSRKGGVPNIHYSMMDMAFWKIQYANDSLKVDFFRNMGTMPIPYLYKYWYTDENEAVSICADIFENIDEWRKKYHETFSQIVTQKHMDWEKEEEYRIILQSGFDYSDPFERRIQYTFDALKSITFGIKTSDEDKYKIAECVRKKCLDSGRGQFDFYQIFYNANDGRLQRKKMKFTV